MANRKVRVNSVYLYQPVLLDVVDSRVTVEKGAVLRVINLHGTPKANTMGMCHVEDVETGKFAGMVCTNSLVGPVKVLNIAKGKK